MSNRLDDLDFTKLGEEFDQTNIKNSPLLSDDHDDNTHIDHTDKPRPVPIDQAT